MKFVCLVYIDSAAAGALSDAEGRQLADDSIAFDWGLRDSGKLILAQPLQEPHAAVTVRQRAGRFSSTDGPFVEAKEHLGGFFLIEAKDIDEAIALAKTSPIMRVASIEVRPALEQVDSVTGRGRPGL
ncbi:YciI family protein [Devosia sp.]|uniref:YciI family protein n=1 Tax=Devosia sp. TaxID=1871048 RepID=UPI003F717390